MFNRALEWFSPLRVTLRSSSWTFGNRTKQKVVAAVRKIQQENKEIRSFKSAEWERQMVPTGG